MARANALQIVRAADFTVLLRPDARFAHAGFPTKLVESLSLGVPVLANVTSDISEYVRDGREGILLAGPTREAFAAGLRRALAIGRPARLAMRITREIAPPSASITVDTPSRCGASWPTPRQRLPMESRGIMMRAILQPLAESSVFAAKVYRRLLMYIHRPLFASYGRNFRFDPFGLYTYCTISVGDDVNFGYRPILMAARSKIRVGNKVIFGPEVILVGGGHNTAEVGRFMFDVTEKQPGDDRGVTIEDDVWIGARAVILRGVTIGRGSIVGAGSVVTMSVPPYSIIGGVPARVVRSRWDVETILQHEQSLYPPESRLMRDALTALTRPQESPASFQASPPAGPIGSPPK